MAVYTVHAPASFGVDVRTMPDKIVFVRDGFYFWAFVAAIIWLVWHRLWLATLGYLLLMLIAEFALSAAGADAGTRLIVMLVVALLMGFEAGSLQRWTLSRRKWRQIGIVVARNERDAEQRFFERWSRETRMENGRGTSSSLPPIPRASLADDAPGFFPVPGTSR